MLEMYGFIAAFAAQILILSVLGSLLTIGSMRAQIRQFIAGKAPPVEADAVALVDGRLKRLQQLALGVAVLGLLLLAAMIRYMLRPDWTDGPLEVVVPVYFGAQIVPILLAAFTAGKFHEVLKRSLPPVKRKALLEPRNLFDFVPRSTVALASVVYFLHIPLLAYVERHPFPGFAGFLTNFVLITLLYGVMALGVFVIIRKMASSPLQGREQRMRTVTVMVRIMVYATILHSISLSVNMALILLDEQRWEPTFASLGIIIAGLLLRRLLQEQLRIPGGDTGIGAATPATAMTR